MHEPELRPVSRSSGTPKKRYMAEPWCLKTYVLSAVVRKETLELKWFNHLFKARAALNSDELDQRLFQVKLVQSPRMEISQTLNSLVPEITQQIGSRQIVLG